jgi:hypothetical protein
MQMESKIAVNKFRFDTVQYMRCWVQGSREKRSTRSSAQSKSSACAGQEVCNGCLGALQQKQEGVQYNLFTCSRKGHVVYIGLLAICTVMTFLNFLCPDQIWALGRQACDQHTCATMLLHAHQLHRKVQRGGFAWTAFLRWDSTLQQKAGSKWLHHHLLWAIGLWFCRWPLLLSVENVQAYSTTTFKMNMDATLNLWWKKNCDVF